MAAENARRHGVAERIQCLQGDLLAPLSGSVQLIVANLPYVASEEWRGLAPEIRDYEPQARSTGPRGLEFVRRCWLAPSHI